MKKTMLRLLLGWARNSVSMEKFYRFI